MIYKQRSLLGREERMSTCGDSPPERPHALIVYRTKAEIEGCAREK